MIDKKQLIEELLECVKDATDTETQITGLSICATLMNEVLDEALTIPVVVKCNCKIPHPQMKVSENGISGYCAKCIKPL